MEAPAASAPQRKRTRRKPRLTTILAVVVFLLAFGATLRFSITPSRRLALMAREEIERFVTKPVVVGEAWIEAASASLILSDVKIGEDPNNPDVDIPRVQIVPAVSWREGFSISRIVVDKPLVKMSALSSGFLRTTESGAVAKIPTILVRNGTFDVKVEPIGSLQLTELDAVGRMSGEHEIQITGSLRTPLHAIVRFGGSGDRATGRFEIRAETDPPVDLAQAPRQGLDPEVLKWRNALEPAGKVGMYAHVLREGTHAPLQIEAQMEASGLSIASNQIPIGDKPLDLRGVNPTDFKLNARLDPQGRVRAWAEGRVFGSAKVELLGEADFQVESGELRDVRIGAHVRQLILGSHVGQIIDGVAKNIGDVYRGLNPEGPVDLTLAYTQARPGAEADLACDVDLSSDLAITFLGFADRQGEIDASFPYRVSDLTGRVSIRPGRVFLTGVRGRIGGGRVTCRGEITGGGLVGIDLGVRGEDVPIDSVLTEALRGIPTNKELLEQLRKNPAWKPVGLRDGSQAMSLFELRGKLGFEVAAFRPQGRSRADVVVRVDSKGGVSGTFREIPIPVDGLVGSVEFVDGNATFSFEGSSRGGTMRAEGRVQDRGPAADGSPSRNAFQVHVSGRQFDLEPKLGEYFQRTAPEVASLFTELEPTARVDFDFLGERAADSPFESPEIAFALQSEGGVIRRVPKLSVELEDVSASMRVYSKPLPNERSDVRILLDAIRSKYFGKPVLASGEVHWRAGAEESRDIEAFGVDLPLQGPLLRKVVASASARAAQALADYSFGGSFDATLSVHKSAFMEASTIEAELRDAALNGPGVPGNLSQFRGRLTVASNGEVHGDLLRGKLNGTPITIDEFAILPGDGKSPVRFSGRAASTEAVDVMDALGRARPALKKRIDDLALTLFAASKGFDFTLLIPNDGSISLWGSGDVDLRDGSALKSRLVKGIRGPAEVQQLIFDESGFEMRGIARGVAFDLWNYPVTDFNGEVEFTANDLVITDGTATIAGGEAVRRSRNDPLFSLVYADVPEWKLSAILDHADLGRVFNRLPLPTSGIEGTLRLGLTLEGKGTDLRSYKGNGAVRVDDGTLFEVPGFRAVYDGLQLKTKPVFREMVGEFRVDRGLARFQRMELRSDPIDLKGDGWVSLDGRLDMTFLPRPKGILISIVTIGGILTFLQDSFVDVSVYGTIDKAQHKVNVPFSARTTLKKQVIAPAPPVDLGERF